MLLAWINIFMAIFKTGTLMEVARLAGDASGEVAAWGATDS